MKSIQHSKIESPSEFQEVFSHFYWAKNKSDKLVKQTLLASYQTIMVFSFGGELKIHTPKQSFVIERCMVLGPVKKAFDYSLAENASLLVINFKHDAFYRFFSQVLQKPPLPMNPDELVAENCLPIFGLK